MGVKVRQKIKGKGNPWWVFVSHNNQRTSKMVGSKAAAEKVAALRTVEYLAQRASRGSREKFEAALAKVPDVEPEDRDRL